MTIPPLRLIQLLIASVGISCAGEYVRFEASVGPGLRPATVHGYILDAKQDRFKIVDVSAMGPEVKSLGDAFASINATAGVSGAAVPDGATFPGYVLLDAKKTGSLQGPGAAADGIFLVAGGIPSLKPLSSLTETELEGVAYALRGGPMLVEGGTARGNLDSKGYARRTVLATSTDGKWAILYVPSATMDGLARMLGDGKTFPGFAVAQAMALPSALHSGIWFERPDKALPLYLREIHPVRFGLAVVPLKKAEAALR
jgi:hypothetical protein